MSAWSWYHTWHTFGRFFPFLVSPEGDWLSSQHKKSPDGSFVKERALRSSWANGWDLREAHLMTIRNSTFFLRNLLGSPSRALDNVVLLFPLDNECLFKSLQAQAFIIKGKMEHRVVIFHFLLFCSYWRVQSLFDPAGSLACKQAERDCYQPSVIKNRKGKWKEAAIKRRT